LIDLAAISEFWREIGNIDAGYGSRVACYEFKYITPEFYPVK